MPKDNRQRNIIIIVAVLVLLCICCSVLGGIWSFLGADIMAELSAIGNLIV